MNHTEQFNELRTGIERILSNVWDRTDTHGNENLPEWGKDSELARHCVRANLAYTARETCRLLDHVAACAGVFFDPYTFHLAVFSTDTTANKQRLIEREAIRRIRAELQLESK